MTTFETIHQDVIAGKLTMADRVIFRGHLTSLFMGNNFRNLLWRQGVRLSEFSRYALKVTEDIKTHVKNIAARAGRPFVYREGATTRANGQGKEDVAREIAAKDGITEGLICVLSVLEPCVSFELRRDSAGKLVPVRRQRKCLHFYLYFIDREFGFMHVRLQSWFPFQIQVYINGREWLCRQLDRRGIGYKRYDNALLSIDDMVSAEQLCERFFHRRWHRFLDALARRINPWLSVMRQVGFAGYYWVTDQCEIATDVMFKSRAALQQILPDLFRHATQQMSSDDVLRFLGRKPHGNFLGEVTSDHKRRAEGRRVKHRVRRNTIKMYDKWSVLRIETTINNPREFSVLRVVDPSHDDCSRRWMPMRKGVANFWRYKQVGTAANHRYLDALAHAQPVCKAVKELDRLCRGRVRCGKVYGRFHPVSNNDCSLFAAALAGQHVLHGFRNRDLTEQLYPHPSSSPKEAKRRCARVSRLIAKLRGHQLVAKVPGRRLYRVTPHGQRVMFAALRYRHTHFPEAFLAAA